MRKFSYAPILLTLLCSFHARPQSVEQLPTRFTDYRNTHLQEKLYVHLDQELHLTGELLWFKVYCVDACMHRPLDLSKIVYAEIIDAANKPVLQTKILMESGRGNGSFFLPVSLSTGKYIFRAYTNWMKNAGATFFFQKEITIINTLKEPEAIESTQSGSVHVQFFPEGGNGVVGLKCKIGFKAVNEQGEGVNCSGFILNSGNDTITRFQTLKFGMGSFNLSLMQNEVYKVKVNWKGGFQEFKLPVFLEKGIVMMVKDSLGQFVKVQVSSTSLEGSVELFVHTRHSPKVFEQKMIANGKTEFLLDRNQLGEGISHLTLFSDNKPVAERLYFKLPAEGLGLKLSTNQKEYSPRKKNTIMLQSSQSANVSISVFKGDSISSNNFINNIFLVSDLQGYVESPEFYFSESPDAREAVDNLMLTQGWRRFLWSEVLGGQKEKIKYLPEVNDHLVQGIIVDKQGNLVAGKIAYLATPGKNCGPYIAKSDSLGKVIFQIKPFLQTSKLIAQTDYLKDSLLQVKIENPFSAEQTSWHPASLRIKLSMGEMLLARSIGMQAQSAYFEDETYFSFSKQNSDDTPFYGSPDEKYLLDDYTRFPELEEVFREYVKGVRVREKNGDFRFNVINMQNNGIFQQNPLVLLDGVPVFNINDVLLLDPLKVKNLDVISRKYFFGPLQLSGVVNLSTYTSDLAGFQLDPRCKILDYEGVQVQREFYSPKYSIKNNSDRRLPDQRQLLYWNPNINLKADELTTLDIYTSDVEGKFTIVVEGISNNGLPAYSTTSFRVSQ